MSNEAKGRKPRTVKSVALSPELAAAKAAIGKHEAKRDEMRKAKEGKRNDDYIFITTEIVVKRARTERTEGYNPQTGKLEWMKNLLIIDVPELGHKDVLAGIYGNNCKDLHALLKTCKWMRRGYEMIADKPIKHRVSLRILKEDAIGKKDVNGKPIYLGVGITIYTDRPDDSNNELWIDGSELFGDDLPEGNSIVNIVKVSKHRHNGNNDVAAAVKQLLSVVQG